MDKTVQRMGGAFSLGNAPSGGLPIAAGYQPLSVAIAGITVKLATTPGAMANRAHNACDGNCELHPVNLGAVILHRSSPEDV